MLISDHALLRYLERVHRLDVKALRADISGRLDAVAQPGFERQVVRYDGMRYLIVEETLVTVIPEAPGYNHNHFRTEAEQ